MQKIITRIFVVLFVLYASVAKPQNAFSLLRTSPPHTGNHESIDGKFQRVKIWLDGKPAAGLAKLGIDLAEGDFRKGVWFTSDFDMATLAKIRHAGYRTEILIDD